MRYRVGDMVGEYEICEVFAETNQYRVMGEGGREGILSEELLCRLEEIYNEIEWALEGQGEEPKYVIGERKIIGREWLTEEEVGGEKERVEEEREQGIERWKTWGEEVGSWEIKGKE